MLSYTGQAVEEVDEDDALPLQIERLREAKE
jgi:hypothetical protein